MRGSRHRRGSESRSIPKCRFDVRAATLEPRDGQPCRAGHPTVVQLCLRDYVGHFIQLINLRFRCLTLAALVCPGWLALAQATPVGDVSTACAAEVQPG